MLVRQCGARCATYTYSKAETTPETTIICQLKKIFAENKDPRCAHFQCVNFMLLVLSQVDF